MEDTLQEIKHFYGLQVERYCRSLNLKPMKVRCGAIQLNTCIDILECSKIIQNGKEESLFNNYLTRICHIPRSPLENKIFTSKEIIHEKNNPYLININAKVKLQEKSNFISSKCVSNNCILDKALSAREIYKNMIKIKVNVLDNIEIDQDISNYLIPILKKFQKRHRKYSYKYHVNQIFNKKRTADYSGRTTQSWEIIDEIELDIKKICFFFNHILRRVVPLELFGSFKNVNIINTLIYRILKSARFQPVYLKAYISRLNVDQIKWLKFVKEESIKWLIVTKLILWFITQYFYYILNRYFHLTAHPDAIGKRLFIRTGKWKVIKKNFIKGQINNKIWVNKLKNDWISSKYEVKLLLKKGGIRPIARASYDTEDKIHMTMLLKFLRQLCVREYRITKIKEFRNKFKAITQERNNSEYKQMLLVCCDLDNAFGSISLDKLSNIIKILCQNLPSKLFLKSVLCLKKDGNLKIEQYFDPLPQALPIGTIFSLRNIKVNPKLPPIYVTKEKLLDDINRCIFGQKVTTNKKEYLINKGILQGTILSNVLSEIYYNYIYHEKLSGFMNSGLLFRYVDDTLYLNENKESAEKFLQIINDGFPEYNCKFKKSKIQTNLPNTTAHTTNKIIFLGHEIYCDSLQVLPYFKNVHPSYLFSLAVINKNHLNAVSIFKQRITNYSHLKLSNVILHNSSTSAYHLIHFLKKISMIQAWRAFMLIQKLFGDSCKLYKNCQEIFHIIKKTNIKIVQECLRYYEKGILKKQIFNKDKMRKKAILSLWSAHKRIFSQNVEMSKIFVNEINEEIKITSRSYRIENEMEESIPLRKHTTK